MLRWLSWARCAKPLLPQCKIIVVRVKRPCIVFVVFGLPSLVVLPGSCLCGIDGQA